MDQSAYPLPPISPSLRSSLWEAAYNELMEDEAELVDAYERLLSAYLAGPGSIPTILASQTNDFEPHDFTKRDLQFKQIAENGFARIQSDAVAQLGAEEGDERMSLLNGIISKALVAVNETAIPWVAVFSGLEVTPDHH